LGSYTPRHVDVALDRLLGELPAVLLTGPRGCGKTTTALRRAESVLRLDRQEQAGPFRAAPDDVLAAQRLPVLIDEWQVVPESMGAVKRAVDSGDGAGRYLLTGSVRARLEPGWPATGRVVPISMYGLTVAEQLRTGRAEDALKDFFGANELSVEELSSPVGLVDYLTLATRGAYPEALGLSDFARTTWYRGYLEHLIRHDVSELTQVRAPARLVSRRWPPWLRRLRSTIEPLPVTLTSSRTFESSSGCPLGPATASTAWQRSRSTTSSILALPRTWSGTPSMVS